MSDDPIQVSNLEKQFRIGFSRRRVQAVRGITFQVPRGDIFGFLGPNGAGKTTTIKMLTGLIAPTSGSAKLLGQPIPSADARKRIGFLPENPYIYPYLTPLEFVELCGQLSGLRGAPLRARARQVLERTGVWYAAERPVRRLSKGMLQRSALAAALVGDPELLILDEPMSGLDPMGRKEVKDIIVEERKNGRTIFFSTHILGDVETLCDRVVILRQGKIVVEGKLDELLRQGTKRASVVLTSASPDLAAWALARGYHSDEVAGRLRLELDATEVNALLERSLAERAVVEEVTPLHQTLEALFVREAFAAPDQAREGN